MFTKTVTLAGAALSSFLAAGGQTVDPNAAATPAAAVVNDNAEIAAATTTPSQVPFPTLVTTTTAAEPTTTSSRAPLVVSPATTSTTSSVIVPSTTSTSMTSTTLPSTTSTTSAAAISAVISSSTRIAISAKAVTSSVPTLVTSRAYSSVRSISSARHSASSAVIGALSAEKSKTTSGGISGGGIAGLIIGLILAFGILAGASILWRKRKQREADEDSNSSRRSEKGMVRLEEEEITTPGVQGGQGFDFGHLPPIVPAAQMNYDPNAFKSSASPATMQQGAALLGIKRPFTPPPGHPAHPNYKQPPAMAARQMQQRAVPEGHPIPPGSQLPMQQAQPIPRRPIPAAAAPIIQKQLQRQLSSNNPFNDPPIAAPLAHSGAPIVVASNAEKRDSTNSFSAGDDSFESETTLAANAADINAKKFSSDNLVPDTPALSFESATTPDLTAQERPMSPASENGQPTRTKSVIAATDDWAARKAHLKNTLALHSNPTSPEADQSPFEDPAPVLDHHMAGLSPMNLEFKDGAGEQ